MKNKNDKTATPPTSSEAAAATKKNPDDIQLVNPSQFIAPFMNQGINTLQAVCEIIDNAFDAGGNEMKVSMREEDVERNGQKVKETWVFFADEGEGMPAEKLEWAFRIGNGRKDRSKIGRFGWGLKAGSVSQAKLVEVYSKVAGAPWHYTFLDCAAIENGEREGFPKPVEVEEPKDYPFKGSKSGSLIVWKNTYGLDPRHPDTLRDTLMSDVGRIYRKFIGKGKKITVGGKLVQAYDPLYQTPGARDYDLLGPGTEFFHLKNILVKNPVTGKEAKVLFRWSWIPRIKVEESAAKKSAEINEKAKEKGKKKISPGMVKERWKFNAEGQGFSILRDGREIEWGSTLNVIKKHPDRNYFRAEIMFDAELDEAFGINTNKSRFFIHSTLRTQLDEAFAGLRHTFEEMRSKGAKDMESTRSEPKGSELIVGEAEKEHRRGQDTKQSDTEIPKELKRLEKEVEQGARTKKDFDALKARIAEARKKHLPLVMDAEHSPGAPFYRPLYTGETSLLFLNTASGFHREIYGPSKGTDLEQQIELMLFAIARAEIEEHRTESDGERTRWYKEMRQFWTTYLDSYLARMEASKKE